MINKTNRPVLLLALSLCLSAKAFAISNRDRVYSGDEVSNTVSVINPVTDTLIGQIRLGNSRPFSLRSTSNQINVHGLDISPDHKTLAITSTITNSVSFIDTETNTLKGRVYVGRSPHISTYRPDGREVWASVRGEDYISIIDPIHMKETKRIHTKPKASVRAALFHPTNGFVYVLYSHYASIDVFNAHTHKLVKSIPTKGKFAAIGFFSPDQKEFWAVQKDVDKVVRINTSSNSVIGYLETGSYTQHIAFSKGHAGTHAFVTVGAEGLVKVYDIAGRDPVLVREVFTGGVPHGVWASDDGEKVYVGLEFEDELVVLDSRKNWSIKKRAPIGKSPQVLMYVNNAVSSQDGNTNLAPLSEANPSHTIYLKQRNVAFANDLGSRYWGAIAIRPLGPVTSLEILLTDFSTQKRNSALSLRVFAARKRSLLGLSLGYDKKKEIGECIIQSDATSCVVESILPRGENYETLLKEGSVFVLNSDKSALQDYILKTAD